MSVPQYELVDQGDRWAAVRDGTDVIGTWDREADPTKPRVGILAQMTAMVEGRWGSVPSWVQTNQGWRAV